MFDLTHGLIFAIGSMTLIISILVIVLLLANSNKKEERELTEAEKSIKTLKLLFKLYYAIFLPKMAIIILPCFL